MCIKTISTAGKNYRCAMEAGDHGLLSVAEVKNGATPKSLIRKGHPTYQHEKLLTELHLEKALPFMT